MVMSPKNTMNSEHSLDLLENAQKKSPNNKCISLSPYLPTYLPPYLPTYLLPSNTCLAPSASPSILSYLHTYLDLPLATLTYLPPHPPTYLPPSLPHTFKPTYTYLPPSLHTYLPLYLPTYLPTSLLSN